MTIVNSLIERMHANKLGVTNGSYVDSSTGFVCGDILNCTTAGANCNSASVAKIDLDNLICGHQSGSGPRIGGVISNTAADSTSFLNGELDITCPTGDCSDGEIQISMQWQEQRFGGTDDATTLLNKDSLVINTRIFR